MIFFSFYVFMNLLMFKINKMAQRIKVMATPDNMSLIPGTHIKVGRREMIQKGASGPLYTCVMAGTHTPSPIIKILHVSLCLLICFNKRNRS